MIGKKMAQVYRFTVIVAVLSTPLYVVIMASGRSVQESGGLVFLLMWVPAAAAAAFVIGFFILRSRRRSGNDTHRNRFKIRLRVSPRPSKQISTRKTAPGKAWRVVPYLVVFLLVASALPADEQQGSTSVRSPADEEGSAEVSIIAGAGAAIAPSARGIDKTAAVPLPYFMINYGKVVSLGTDGLILRPTAVASGLPFHASLFLIPESGRHERFLPDRYSGVGDVAATVEGGMRTGFSFLGIVGFDLLIAADVLGRGHGGVRGAGAVSFRLPFMKAGLMMELELALVAGSPSYMDSYYGVDAEQADATGFEIYEPGYGMEGARGSFTLQKSLGAHWRLMGNITFMELAGPAEESPLVERSRQHAIQLMTAYRF